MLELILQQRYRVDGIPVDLSPYRNHGSGIGTVSAPGPSPGETAVAFPQLNSRVQVQPTASQGWSSLLAIKVEVVARLEPGGGFMCGLVEADGAFNFQISQFALAAQIAGPGGAFVRAADAFAPDGGFHPVPTDRWITLGFAHDGFSKIQLTMDDELVGQADVSTGVPPLQGSVVIGNDVSGSRQLNGQIEEVRVWRSDPKTMQREFLCRPYTRATAACWEAIFKDVQGWATKEPAAFASMLRVLEQGERALIRGLFLLAPADQVEARNLIRHFMKLWCAGEIHGEAMRKVIREWLKMLNKHGLDTNRRESAAELQRILDGAYAKAPTIDPTCDPANKAFLLLITEEESKQAGGVTHGAHV